MTSFSIKTLSVLLLVFIQISVPSYGQEINELYVVDEKIEIATGQIIRNSEENMDGNGQLAAGLLIYSDLPNLTFESNNGVIKSNKNPGRWLLYLSPNERIVTVYGTEFVPKRIILSEYGVNLESGRVWELTITGEKKANDVPVVIRTEPTSADVRINGDITDFSTSKLLKPGEYSIEIIEEGYEPFSDVINVSTQNTFFEFELVKLEPQLITITTNPAGSLIKINGMEEGVTDSQGKLTVFKFPGQYSIEANYSGFLSEERTVEVLNNDANNYAFELEKNSGSVQFRVTPSDAQLTINKREYKVNETVDLAPGLYQIDINKEGYKPKTYEINVGRGGALLEEITLEPYTGTVFFTASPSYAKVVLYDDGNNQVESWEGSKKIEDLRYGTYRYQIEAASYMTQEGSMRVNSDNVSVNIDLEKKESDPAISDKPAISSLTSNNSGLSVMGNPVISSGDIIVDRDDHRDVNTDLTAGLKVKTDLPGLQFSSNNGILKAKQLPGAILLYLSKSERVVTVYKDGYSPLEINLSNYGIKLESGKVWEIEITGNQQATMVPVLFNISPLNSAIYIDGRKYQVSGSELKTELETGEHFIQIRKNQYEIIEDFISVSASDQNIFTYSLDGINPLLVFINSTPQGADIYLNDSQSTSGETPKSMLLYPGDLKIRLSLPGYASIEDEFVFTGEIKEFSYNLQGTSGTREINTNPSDPKVLAGDVVNADQESGRLFFIAHQPDMKLTMTKGGEVVEEWIGSKTFRDLPIGKYVITATLENYKTKTEEVEVFLDDTRIIEFYLFRE